MRARHVATALGLLLAVAHPAAGRADEDDLKAALVYRFTTFVEWSQTPVDAATALKIGVLGADVVASKLEHVVEGRHVAGRPIEVERLSSVRGAARCQVVYLGERAEDQLAALLAGVAGGGVLTIGEMPGFARRGGMVELRRQGSRLAFEIHRGAATRAGLRISPTVLKLAEKVHEDAGAEGS
jgi:hypothetical protein